MIATIPVSGTCCALRRSHRSRSAGTACERVCVSTPAACATLAAATLDVAVVGERLGDQRVEHRVAELLPPCGVRGFVRPTSARSDTASGVSIGRPLVVRTHHAAREQHRAQRRDRLACACQTSSRRRVLERPAVPIRSPMRPAVATVRLLSPPSLSAIEEVEKQRHVQHRERRLADHPADDAGADRVPRVGPGAHRERERQTAEREGERGHDDRTQPLLAGELRRFHDRLALVTELDRRGDAQHRVLGAESDQHQQADLEVDVVLESAQPVGNERAENAERHRAHHCTRQRPRFVLRRRARGTR